jgi:molybdopterin converting factor small subunit
MFGNNVLTLWTLKEIHAVQYAEKNKLRKRTNLMRITVKLFGRYKDIIGKEKIQLDIIGGNTLQDIVNAFVKQYPAVEKDKTRMMVTKNKMYASFDTTIAEEDEITVSPPVVSGG